MFIQRADDDHLKRSRDAPRGVGREPCEFQKVNNSHAPYSSLRQRAAPSPHSTFPLLSSRTAQLPASSVVRMHICLAKLETRRHLASPKHCARER
ncbi:hypothetical protein XELAEV_18016952mg [Xenopus laevis]|uniref:Uncharacterized protein n=1 Tax=Xenopus laevis TaxID=8355 RepID=A0A974DCZ8_XENLA|nr:hypothetical protein XELAEV_18016952mg [Xenopus laevis]